LRGDAPVAPGRYVKLDAGIKTVLAILLCAAASFCTSRVDFLYFSAYLLLITFLLGSNLRFVLKNLAAYGVIIVFPYLCGLLLSLLINRLFSGPVYAGDFEAAILRMTRIFFIWYISSLYFFTTPIQPLTEMLNKVLSPLNSLGVPVAKHLNMARVIVKELNRSAARFKQDMLEQTRQIFQNNRRGIKAKFSALSSILVAFIANSLQQTDEIQKQVEMTGQTDCRYGFRFTQNELLAIASFIVFLWVFL